MIKSKVMSVVMSQETKYTGCVTCWSDEMSSANYQRQYSLLWKAIISGHLDCLRLSSKICHKYLLQWSNLLPTPFLIFSNAPPLSLSLSLSLHNPALPPHCLCLYINPVMHYHVINLQTYSIKNCSHFKGCTYTKQKVCAGREGVE